MRRLQRRLEGQRLLITGAGSGIGRAIAEGAAEEGALVAAVDVRGSSADEVSSKIREGGGTAFGLAADVADSEVMARCMAETVELLGGLDGVVTAAGVTREAATHELTVDAWNRLLAINLTGTFLAVRHAVPHLMQGGGSIVTIGSVASLVGAGRTTAYDASKGAVLQFTRSLAVEYGDRGIRANCVCPGIIDTGLAENSKAEFGEADLGRIDRPGFTRVDPPMGRHGTPREVANAVTFLLSDAASFITGIALPVDGGYTAI